MQENEIIRCMLLPLCSEFLVFPNVSVAEVIAYVDPDEINEKDVLLGYINWRGVKVPIISFEKACDLEVPVNSSRDRVAIIYHPDGDADRPYIGIKLTDIPRAFNATSETLIQEQSGETSALVKFQMNYHDERLLIPDVDALFELI